MSVSDSQIIRALEASGGNKEKAARSLNMPSSTLKSRCSRMGMPDSARGEYAETITDNERVIEYKGARFNTVEEALAYADVDQSIWEVDRIVVNGWDVTANVNNKLETIQNKQIKIWLKRRLPKTITDAAEELIERMKKHSPRYPKFKKVKITDPHLLEISIFDTHFGKLAWAKETDHNYDVKIAVHLFSTAVSDLVTKVQGYPIEKILVPIGQDFFHIDSPKNQTFNDTTVDVDGRFPKIFSTGCMACVDMIDTLLEIAPVEVICVPGNHDRSSAWLLAHYLNGHYRLCKRVHIDISPKLRKYVLYGISLIGFTHGDEEKQANLPLIMAGEVPDMWAASKHREIHTGHWHKRKEMHYNAADSHVGIVVRVLPSLSGTDYWHYAKGFVNNTRAAEAYLWSKKYGYTGHFSSNVK